MVPDPVFARGSERSRSYRRDVHDILSLLNVIRDIQTRRLETFTGTDDASEGEYYGFVGVAIDCEQYTYLWLAAMRKCLEGNVTVLLCDAS